MDFRRTELWGFGALALFAATTALPEVAPRPIAGKDASASSWRVLPVFGGGFVQNVVVAPSNPSRWYTYVDVGGPYRSDDGGRTWSPIHAAMPPEMRDVWADHVRALSVDPRNADTFVMAAGDRFAKPAGVYITRDGGRTFRQTLTARFYGDGNRRWMGQCMARHPRNPDILYCGEDWDGIFRSDDGGETWRRMGLERTWITDIRIDPAYPDTLYVCAPKLPMSRQIRPGDPRERETGFFRSDDGGATWRRSPSEAIPSETAQIAGSPRLVGLVGGRHVLCSDDGGATWLPFEEGLLVRPDDVKLEYVDDGNYQALAAGPDFWLVGNTRGAIFRREDGGRFVETPLPGNATGRDASTMRPQNVSCSWQPVQRASATLGDPVAEHHHVKRAAMGEFWSLATLIIDPGDPAHWIGTDWFHIWETDDAGRTWTSHVVGMSQLVPFTIACDPFSPDNILYGMADLGLSISHDGGASFHGDAPISGANSIDWSRRTQGLAYCVGGKFGIQFVRTRDGGHTWVKPRGAGLPPFRKGNHGDAEKEFAAYTVAVDPVTDDVFLCVSGPSGPEGGGVWRSHDQGETFERVSDGLPEGRNLFKSWEFDGGGEAGWTPQLVFSPDGSAVLSTYNGRCYALERQDSGRFVETPLPDGATGRDASTMRPQGIRWTPTTVENPSCSRTIAADPFRPGRFLAAIGETLMESDDGGRTWFSVPAEGWQRGWSVAFDPHVPGLVAGAGHDGIVISGDGGATWKPLEGGLAYPTGVRRCVVLDRGRLFGLTRGSGVWMRDILH